MPFKDFASGAVLTAQQVDDFLMRQSVMTFADSTERGTAIGTAVAEGMVTFLLDSDSMEYYDGAAWQAISGDPAIFTAGTAGQYLQSNGTAGVVWDTLATNDIDQGVSSQSGSYTTLAGDANTLIRLTGTTQTITIANVLAVGEYITFANIGNGTKTFAAGSGVTLLSAESKVTMDTQYAVCVVSCTASGEYLLTGRLA